MHFAGASENISKRRRRGQRGEGRGKAILFTVIFLMAIYAAFKLVPAYVSEYQLNDKVNRYTPEQIRENIFKVVEDLDIPAKREDIKVTATPEVVKISLDYTVPVNLLVYSTELHFSPSSENKSLF